MFSLSAVLPFLTNYFEGFAEALIGSSAAKSLETGIVSFVKTDVGKLAIDAVQYADTLPPGGTNAELHAAAVTQFKADLTKAGHDITTLAESTFDLFVQAAYTYVKGTITAIVPATVTAAVPAPAAVAEPEPAAA